jgi:FKBP-type peptidyl-prolyl cis-trans isomerase FkpA
MRFATLILLAAGMTACAATPWQGTMLDPAQVTFSQELGIDLSQMEQPEPGLYVLDVAQGVGEVANRTSRVRVHFVLWLVDGTVLDTSVGSEPFQFRLGGNEVIEAWNLAIPGMKVGGRRRLVVRPGLAYGSRGTDGVPSDATLVFEVQLMDVG